MADGKSSHHLIDLDPGIVAYLGIGHEDHKSLHSGNAIALAGNVLDLDIVLFSRCNRYSWSGSAIGRSCFTSEQAFTVLSENQKTVLRWSWPQHLTIKFFCSIRPIYFF